MGSVVFAVTFAPMAVPPVFHVVEADAAVGWTKSVGNEVVPVPANVVPFNKTGEAEAAPLAWNVVALATFPPVKLAEVGTTTKSAVPLVVTTTNDCAGSVAELFAPFKLSVPFGVKV